VNESRQGQSLYFAVFGFDRSSLLGNSHKQTPRPLRVEFPGAVYHTIARGGQDDFIFAHDRTARNSKIQGLTLGLSEQTGRTVFNHAKLRIKK